MRKSNYLDGHGQIITTVEDEVVVAALNLTLLRSAAARRMISCGRGLPELTYRKFQLNDKLFPGNDGSMF